MTKHCPDGALLLAFVEGRASSEEARQVEKHIAECAECAAEVEALAHLVAALASIEARVGRAAAKPRRTPDCNDGSCGQGYDAAAFLDGLADPAARARFEEHAMECPTCFEELSDLMAARRADAPLVGEDVVARALERLRAERSRVVLRLSEGALQFIEGWIESATNFAARTGFEAREPALTGARSDETPVTLHWESDGGYVFDCELTAGPTGSELVGRVLRDGAPAVDMSVALRGAGVPRGPESVDLDGRFGPWHLEPGESELRFEALRLPHGSVAVALEISRDAAAGENSGPSGA